MAKAVFLDRDGTLNELFLNPRTGEWESPHAPSETRLVPDLGEALRLLRGAGFELYVVTNQPSAAKGKCSLGDLVAVQAVVDAGVRAEGVEIRHWFACYHHPQGLVPDLTRDCECRKPGSLFLRQARDAYGVDLKASWFLGDTDADIGCGQAEGLRTALIEDPHSAHRRGKRTPDLRAGTLLEAARAIAAA